MGKLSGHIEHILKQFQEEGDFDYMDWEYVIHCGKDLDSDRPSTQRYHNRVEGASVQQKQIRNINDALVEYKMIRLKALIYCLWNLTFFVNILFK